MTTSLRLDRRSFLVQSTGVGAALLLPRRHAWAADAGEPVVDTTSGKIRGVTVNGIAAFKGIPYGASTAGAQPVHAAAEAGPVGRGARGCRLGRACATSFLRPAASRGVALGASPGHGAGQRRLPDAQSVDARPRRRQAPGHGVVSRRRVLLWVGQYAAHRRRQSRSPRRCRRRDRQPSPQHFWVSRSCGTRRRRLRALGQCRSARPRRRAAMGPRQYREFWRRSRQRDDLRPIRRRRKGQRPAGDAGGKRAVPARHRDERRRHPHGRTRTRDKARRRRCWARSG